MVPDASGHQDLQAEETVVSEFGATVELIELLLRYIARNVLPCVDLPVEEGAIQLSDTWPTIALAISLIQVLLKQSNDQLHEEIARRIMVEHPGVIKAIEWSYEMALTCSQSEYKRPICKHSKCLHHYMYVMSPILTL